MFGLETIRDALINFSAGTPSGQAYLAQQREAAQQAQLFPLQLQMAQAQAAKAQQDIEMQGLKSKALAGVLSRIGGGGQQQQQGGAQLTQQDLTALSLVDPDTAQSIIRAAQESRLQQQAALGDAAVYAIDPNTGNRIMLQPPRQGIQNFFGGAPTGTGQIAQALGTIPPAPPVSSQSLTPLSSPTATPSVGRNQINAPAGDIDAMAADIYGGATNVPQGEVAGISGAPSIFDTAAKPLETATVAGAASLTPRTAQKLQEANVDKETKAFEITGTSVQKAVDKFKEDNPVNPSSIPNANKLIKLAGSMPSGGAEKFIAPLRSLAADVGVSSEALKGASQQQIYSAITSLESIPDVAALAPASDSDAARVQNTFGKITNTAAANLTLAAMAGEKVRLRSALTNAKEQYAKMVLDPKTPRENIPVEQEFLKGWFAENFTPNPAITALADMLEGDYGDIRVIRDENYNNGIPMITGKKNGKRIGISIEALEAK
jgi:hypothetical protein